MKKDDIGNRMKSAYEDRTRFTLPRRSHTIIRIDGKAATQAYRSAIALKPADEPIPQQPPVSAAEAPDEPPADADWENRFAWHKPRQRTRATWAGAGAVLLALALVGQLRKFAAERLRVGRRQRLDGQPRAGCGDSPFGGKRLGWRDAVGAAGAVRVGPETGHGQWCRPSPRGVFSTRRGSGFPTAPAKIVSVLQNRRAV